MKTRIKLLNIGIIVFLITSSSLESQCIRQNSGISSELISVYFINQTTGFACGSFGHILKTTNSGINWTASVVLDTSAVYTSIFFINQNTGFIAGRIRIIGSPLIANPVIIKTTNGGGSWSSLLNDSGYTLWSVYFINENTGFAVGGLFTIGQNKFLSTTDGGTHWLIASLTMPGYLESITFNDINTGYVVGFAGYTYKTTNSGQNWNMISHVSISQFSITFINPSTGFIAGGNTLDSTGYIYRTTNSGVNWESVYSDNLGFLNSVTFVNSNTGFVVGSCAFIIYPFSARIVKTTNSGNSWYIDTVFSNIDGLSSVFFTDEYTGYAVGDNGSIFKTTTAGNPIGIKQVSEKIPKSFNLEQNYPNPFNPVTKIKFDIPPLKGAGGMLTKISVYDILGREVVVLVNEELKPGTYEVTWDASTYPSGVYFYRLIAQNYSETRKMVLIK